ncbi:RNA polymerase sigma factor [Sinomicrobium soli]|uniref:RNA polymerase sigma factor n=1 Tax=Sinomicrobium sp. N-1-3-6 TaxID=2219864 RepID=UPI000DCB5E2D|nr:RNA polymerase sigma factor [Sinomicrobium sp. N-1-3-6]RAV29203.1 sigma-70 family RNA polymerase sigma factor [Sinomicrobium sp. N-1-3-6]
MKADFILRQHVSDTNRNGDRITRDQFTDDMQLWQRFQAGDREAFCAMYARHFSVLYHYGLQMVRDRELVKDAIQNFFIYLWEHREGLGKVQVLKAYLLVGLRRTMIRQAREAGKLLHTIDEDDKWPEIATEEPNVHLAWETRETHRELQAALSQLSQRQQEVLHLKFHAGLSYSQIAEVLNLKKDNVSYHIRQAFEKLREVMGT